MNDTIETSLHAARRRLTIESEDIRLGLLYRDLPPTRKIALLQEIDDKLLQIETQLLLRAIAQAPAKKPFWKRLFRI